MEGTVDDIDDDVGELVSGKITVVEEEGTWEEVANTDELDTSEDDESLEIIVVVALLKEEVGMAMEVSVET